MGCCKEWDEQASRIGPLVGGIGMYPPQMRPKAQIEFSEGSWCVNGCCGGGCFVLSDLKFCPWCGSRLTETEAACNHDPSSPDATPRVIEGAGQRYECAQCSSESETGD